MALDPQKLTERVASSINGAVDLAKEQQHQTLTPVHLAVVLFEEPQGELQGRGSQASQYPAKPLSCSATRVSFCTFIARAEMGCPGSLRHSQLCCNSC